MSISRPSLIVKGKMSPMCLLIALTCVYFAEGLSPCTTPNGKTGDCKSVIECPSLRAIINKPGTTQAEIALLKQSACGFQYNVPKVCCPLEEPPALQPNNNSCFTPEGSPGQCLSVFDCNHVAERLLSPAVTHEDRAYVYSIRCSSTAGFHVCCGPPNHASETTLDVDVPLGNCISSAALPDPQTGCCGLDGSTNKITEGTATGIDQYPWLTLIEYTRHGKIYLLCGGVLISGRYVLTAAHCVVETVATPTNVRLGEYDTSSSGPDCVQAEGGDEGDLDCAEQAITIPITQIIPHPEYNPRSPLKRNDIALLRLAKSAPYTDFVRPICLPTADVTVDMPANGKLFAAGWGAISDEILSSNVKLHVTLPYSNLQTCQRAYLTPNRRVKLWERQICAGGEDGKDTCKGDSGGPLMFSTGTIYEVVGVVSFGSAPCGLDNIPGVYTKVFDYIPWIRSNVRN